VRVYYEDTDSGGVVYYANYLKFMERARTEMLRAAGFEQDRLLQEQGVLFAVHSVSIQYRKPARFNDELEIVTTIHSLAKASIHFKQSIFLSATHHQAQGSVQVGSMLSDADIKVACLHARSFSPQVIPETITRRLHQEFYNGS